MSLRRQSAVNAYARSTDFTPVAPLSDASMEWLAVAAVSKRKTKRRALRNGLAAVSALAMGAFAPSATEAAVFYWDANGASTAAVVATGTWGSSNFWSTDSTGATPTVAQTIDNTSDVTFAAGSNSLGGTVTISGTQAAHSINYDDGIGFTLSGGTAINLGSATAGSGIFLTGGAGGQVISTGLILNSAATSIAFSNGSTQLLTIGAVTGSATSGTQTITVSGSNSGNTTLGGIIGNGAAGGIVALSINNTSTGITNLNAANTYSGGTTITAGTVKIGNGTALGANTGAVSVANGGVLDVNGITMTGTNALTLNGSGIGGTGALINSSNTNARYNGAITLNSASTIGNTGTGTLILGSSGNNINTNGFNLTLKGVGGSSTINITGNGWGITGAGGVIVDNVYLDLRGGGLASTNTYTGGTTVINGGAILYSGNNVGSTTVGNINLNGGEFVGYNNETVGRTFGSGNGQIQITGNTSGFGTNGTTTINFSNITSVTWGSATFNPSVFILGSSKGSNGGTTTFAEAIDLNAATRTITTVSTNNNGAVSGVISTSSGTAGLIKTGAGTLSLTSGSANTYNGGTTISAGTLAVGTTSSLGSNVNTNNVSLAAGTQLNLSAAGNTGANQTITLTSTAGSLSVLALGYNGIPAAAITQADTNGGVIAINAVVGYNQNLSTLLSGNNYFLGGIGTTSTFTGAAANVAAGAGSLYRLGGGGGTISFNTANLFTGGNAVQIGSTATNGTGSVVFGASQNFTAGVTVNSGSTLTLSVSQGFAGGIAVANGGTLTINSTQGFAGGVTLASGGNINLAIGLSGAVFGTGDLTVNGGTITTPTTGSFTSTNNNAWNGSFNLQRGVSGVSVWQNNGTIVLGGNVTVNSNNNGFNLNLANTISETGGSRSLALTGNTLAVTLSGANTFSGGVNMGTQSLNINNSGSGGTSSAIGTGTLTVGGGTIDNTSGSAVTLSTNNALALNGNFTFTGSNDLNMGTGGVTIGAARSITVSAKTFAMGGITGSTFTLTKLGTGTLQISGPSTGSGTYTVSAGVLRLNNATALPGGIASTGGTALLSLDGGVLGLGAGNFSRGIGTGVTQFQFTANGGGFAAYGGNRTVGVGTLNWGATVGTNIIGTLILSAADSDGTITWSGNISQAGATRTIQVEDGSAAVDAVISGTILNNAGGLTKTGTGTLALTAADVYTGATTVSAGTLMLGNNTAAGSIGTTSAISVASGATLSINRTGTITQATDLGGVLISGAGNFTHAGSGTTTLSLSNTYTGVTTISGGVLVADILGSNAAASSIGNPGSASTGFLVIAGGTLRHDAATIASTDRLFTIGGSTGDTATLDSSAASSTNVMSFTRAQPIAFGNTNAHTLTLTGTNTGINTFACTLGDNTGATSLAKSGAGTWWVTGANTYTGTTTLSGGTASTLVADNATALGNGGNITFAGNGTIQYTSNSAGTDWSTRFKNSTFAIGINTNGQNVTFAGVIDSTNANGLIKYGSGNLTLSNANTFTGQVFIDQGAVVVAANAPVSAAGALGNSSTEIGLGTANSGSFAQLQTSGAFTVARSIRLRTSNNTDGGSRQVTVGGTTAANSVFSGDLFLGSLNNASYGVRLTAATSGTVTFSGVIQDPTGQDASEATNAAALTAVTKVGGGTVVLSNANTYAGKTLISAGTLQIGDGGTTGSLASAAVVTNNAALVYNRSDTLSVSYSTTGTGSLTQAGSGTLNLTGTNSYGGATNVNAGTLLINGDNSAATGAVTVANTATLGGLGTIGGAVTVQSGGSLTPGNSPGKLTVDSLTLNSGSSTNMELGGTTLGTQYDNIKVTGATLSYGGSLTVVNVGGYDMTLANATYDLFDIGILTSSTDFGSVVVNTVPLTNSLGVWSGSSGGISYSFDQTSGDLTVAVPEPTSLTLLGLGAMGLLKRRRRR